jgi:hypothetical protein
MFHWDLGKLQAFDGIIHEAARRSFILTLTMLS